MQTARDIASTDVRAAMLGTFGAQLCATQKWKMAFQSHPMAIIGIQPLEAPSPMVLCVGILVGLTIQQRVATCRGKQSSSPCCNSHLVHITFTAGNETAPLSHFLRGALRWRRQLLHDAQATRTPGIRSEFHARACNLFHR